MNDPFAHYREGPDSLTHYGIKGMKWGVRKDRDGVSRKTRREANKDAKEYTKAKMFYGEGAGVRRRLINNTVKAKSQKDPSYKKAFDEAVAGTDMSKRATQARGARKRRNASNATKKTARGIGHVFKGNIQYASITAIALVAGAKATGADKWIVQKGKDTFQQVKNSDAAKRAAEEIIKRFSR